MSIVSQEPDPGRTGGDQRWDYLSVKNGTTVAAFLAAHPFGVWCHHDYGSKPCRIRVTAGAIPCPRCNPDRPAVWRGYTAIWSREYRPMFVIVTEDYLEAVREIPIGSQVKIARGNKVYDPAVIRAELWRTEPLPPSAARERPIDLMPSLLKLWEDADLTKWHTESRPAPVSVTPVSPPADVPAAIAERMAGWVRPSDEAIDAKLDESIARLRHQGESLKRGRPSKNGTHPPAGD